MDMRALSELVYKNVEFCTSCFWAHPEGYTHIAGRKERQIVLTFTDNEIEDYNKLIELVGIEQAEKTIKQLVADLFMMIKAI